MKLTMEEAEKLKAYCGRCQHWRFLSDDEYDSPYIRHDGITRDDCATTDRSKMPCILGFCEIRKERNFCDEMYAGEYGAPEDCFDWEPWQSQNESQEG